MTVAGLVELAALEEPDDVVDQDLALEVSDRPGLGGRQVRGVADGEHVRTDLGLQRGNVRRYEVHRIAQTRAAPHVGRTAVQRRHDGEVELELSAVVADELPGAVARALHRPGVELGDEFDPFVREQIVKGRRRHGLGECVVERRHRTLDRHVDHVYKQPDG